MPKLTVPAEKYTLTVDGKALQAAAADKDSPAKGIIETKHGKVTIKDLKDGDPELAKLAGTNYVEKAS